VDEKEFHTKRRMVFVCEDLTVLIAPRGMQATHADWLGRVFGWDVAQKLIETNLRGYELDGKLVVYTGDFSPRVNQDQLDAILKVAVNLFDLHTVGFGARNAPTQPWPPRVEKPIMQLLKLLSRGSNELEAIHPRSNPADPPNTPNRAGGLDRDC